MKLQKQISRVLGGKEYAKWMVVIPPPYIAELNWQEGQELKALTERDSLILKPLSEKELLKSQAEKAIRPNYEQFRDRILDLLSNEPDGLTWTQIKERLGLRQKVPNNRWVYQMEQEDGLIRKKTGLRTVWRVSPKNRQR